MTDRTGTILDGRRERLERLLGKRLQRPLGTEEGLSPRQRGYLRDEAEDLYWNEMEWEKITDEEQLESGTLTEQAFPGFLAFVRGLLLTEVMPDALAPAAPRPEVVEDVLDFLAGRVVELEDGMCEPGDGDDDVERLRTEMGMTSRLIDLVLYRYHDLGPSEIERVEGDRRAAR